MAINFTFIKSVPISNSTIRISITHFSKEIKSLNTNTSIELQYCIIIALYNLHFVHFVFSLTLSNITCSRITYEQFMSIF